MQPSPAFLLQSSSNIQNCFHGKDRSLSIVQQIVCLRLLIGAHPLSSPSPSYFYFQSFLTFIPSFLAFAIRVLYNFIAFIRHKVLCRCLKLAQASMGKHIFNSWSGFYVSSLSKPFSFLWSPSRISFLSSEAVSGCLHCVWFTLFHWTIHPSACHRLSFIRFLLHFLTQLQMLQTRQVMCTFLENCLYWQESCWFRWSFCSSLPSWKGGRWAFEIWATSFVSFLQWLSLKPLYLRA